MKTIWKKVLLCKYPNLPFHVLAPGQYKLLPVFAADAGMDGSVVVKCLTNII
jgi:hypothetical protein